jgi:two pore calcium channel protein
MYGSLLTSKLRVSIPEMYMIIPSDALIYAHVYLSRSSRWYSLFFVIYVLLGVYFLTNLILAVIYDSFKEQVDSSVHPNYLYH